VATTPDIIQISWIDAVADSGWEEKVKAEIHQCITVGFLVHETDEAICIASTWSDTETNARMHIPKAWIKDRKVLNETTVSESKGTKPAKVGSKRVAKKVSATKRTRFTQLSDGQSWGRYSDVSVGEGRNPSLN
jgi:hypothetical protein